MFEILLVTAIISVLINIYLYINNRQIAAIYADTNNLLNQEIVYLQNEVARVWELKPEGLSEAEARINELALQNNALTLRNSSLYHQLTQLTIQDTNPVHLAAIEITKAIQLNDPDQNGEWKRHQAFAKLIDKFPEASKRDLALAIELAIRA